MPLEERIIFSGNLFQYQEENKKWRNRFSLVPHNYGLVLYENKVVRCPPGLPGPAPCFFRVLTAPYSAIVNAARPRFLNMRPHTSTLSQPSHLSRCHQAQS